MSQETDWTSSEIKGGFLDNYLIELEIAGFEQEFYRELFLSSRFKIFVVSTIQRA